jgi:hypothetical protein
MRGGNRFSLATNAERVCAEIMLKQRNDATEASIALVPRAPREAPARVAEADAECTAEAILDRFIEGIAKRPPPAQG